jgi:diaminobutyrate-2-oxoglutarate transaminase
MIGVRCADPVRAAAVTKKAYTYGLIIERAGPEDEVIKCMMPLTTSFAELDEGLDILARSLAEELGAASRPTVVRGQAPELKLLV